MANQMDLKIISTFSAMASCIQLLEQAAVGKVLLHKQARCAIQSQDATLEFHHDYVPGHAHGHNVHRRPVAEIQAKATPTVPCNAS